MEAEWIYQYKLKTKRFRLAKLNNKYRSIADHLFCFEYKKSGSWNQKYFWRIK